MKLSLLTLLLTGMVFVANAQFSLDHYHPAERIASEGIDTCFVYTVNSDSTLTLKQSYVYDASGREIENRRDFQKFSFVYRYNSEGRKEAMYFVPFGESFYERDTLLYDKKGRLIKTYTYNRKGKESTRHEYDYKRSQVKEERYFLNGNLQVKSIYHYNNQKQVSKIERHFRGKHHEDWIHEYDSLGNKISFITLNPKGDTTLRHTFAYNTEGLQIEHAVYSLGNELSTVFRSKYDEKKLLLWEKTITEIKDNDPLTGDVSKEIYTYSYRL